MFTEGKAKRNSVSPDCPPSPQASQKTTRHDASNVPNAEDRHLFGMKVNGYFPQQDTNDDYERRFPEDPMGEETGPNARVWRTYVVESAAFDENMAGEARDGLDAMLVFAGLFSAVVTTFVVQTSDDLQVDYTNMSASLLSELIAVQRAAATNASVEAVPTSPLNLTTQFIPQTHDIWVNGLWFVSLSLSLVVALGSVLVKQWLHRYIALGSGTPRDRSLVRQFRFDGLEKWQVLAIIGSLPVIMNLSLALFFVGLVLFLLPLQLVLCCIICGITVVVLTLYVVSNLLPIFYPQCPYQTPLSEFILASGPRFRCVVTALKLLKDRVFGPDDNGRFASGISTRFLWLKDLEKKSVSRKDTSLSVQALHWLFSVSSNPSVHSVVLQAMSGLPVAAAAEVQSRFAFADISPVYDTLLTSCTNETDETGFPKMRYTKAGLETTSERLSRVSLLFEQLHPLALRISSGPRFMATSLACYGRFEATMPDYREFILANHQVSHHPLVWISLVRRAMESDDFYDHRNNPEIFALLIPILCNDPFISSDAPLKTMSETVRSHMLEEFSEHLLLTSEAFDVVASRVVLPHKRMEALAGAMEWALRCVRDKPSDFESVHWDIIGISLNTYNDYHLEMEPMVHEFFSEFAARLIIHTNICGPHPQRIRKVLHLRTKVLGLYYFYLASSWPPTPRQKDKQAEDFKSVSFCRAVEECIRDIPYAYPSERPNHILQDLLYLALTQGRPAAFRFIVECNYLELACKYDSNLGWGHAGQVVSLLVDASLSSSKLIETAVKNICVDYLYNPQTLLLTILSSMIDHSSTVGSPDNPLNALISRLVSLRPEQSYWSDCREWLALVSKWITDVENMQQPPKDLPPELGEKWMRHGFLILAEADPSIPKTAIFILDELFATGQYRPITRDNTQTLSHAATTFRSPASVFADGRSLDQTRRKPLWNLRTKVLGWRKSSQKGLTDVELEASSE